MADLGSLVVKLSAETSEFRADLGRTARLLDRHANDMKASMQQVATVAKTAFAVAVGAASVSALRDFIDRTIEATAALQQLSEQTGASTTALSGLAPVATISGTAMETIGTNLSKLSKALAGVDDEGADASKALQRFKEAGNMTDRFNALSALVVSGHRLAAQALDRFHSLFKDEALVLDKWFALQAGAPDHGGDRLPVVRQLMNHPDFNIRNPNRARSLIFSYCSANPGAFHRTDAAGYVFWSDRVMELDAINPQVAARLARALDRWKRLVEPCRSAAREAIARVAAKPDLSNDVREVVTRALE